MATACRIGDTALTTCRSTRRTLSRTGGGVPTSTRVGPTTRSATTSHSVTADPGPCSGLGLVVTCRLVLRQLAIESVQNGLPKRFYAWASVIVDGRVVATDYAPDVGWLDRSPDAKPLPKPGGTYVLQDPFPVHLSMTVPDGWTDHGGPELTRDGGDTNLRFRVVDNLEDSCPDAIEPPLGPSIDDLVSYLEALPNIDISEIRYDTLDGYRAAYLEYRANDIRRLSVCAGP